MSRVGATIQSARVRFKRAVRRLLPMRWRRVGKRGPISMILLLRKAHAFPEEEIRRAAESAWGLSFSSLETSVRRIAETDDGFSIQAGPHVLSVCNYSKPYEEKPEEDLDWLPQASQQRAWADHSACCWINYWTAATDLELAHCVLAKVVVRLLNENGTGVYIPSEDSLIPAEGAAEDLQRMGSYRFSGLIPD